MGYYSVIMTNVYAKSTMIKRIRADVKSCKGVLDLYSGNRAKYEKQMEVLRKKYKDREGDYGLYHLSLLCVSDEGELHFEELVQKWYGTKTLAEYLKDKVLPGTITFDGEDGEGHGYKFDGEGKYQNMVKVWRVVPAKGVRRGK